MEAKKKRPERGEYGYLKWKKKRCFWHTVLLAAVAAGIFILGLCLNKMEVANVFTVLAMLMVLPMAKSLVAVILLLPYRPHTKEEAKRLSALAGPEDIVLFDVVFTSAESPMHLDAVFFTGHQILGYTARKKDKPENIKKYLEKELKARCLDSVVFLTTEETALKKRLALRGDAMEKSTQQKEAFEMFRTWIV